MLKKYYVLLLPIFILSCTHSPKEKVHEYIVVGGGLMGSSTAWQLANQGHSVLLLEKQSAEYSEGSSYGEARIARSSNRGNDLWSYLHNLSVQEVGELIEFLSESDDSKSYKMDDIYTTSPVTYVGRMSIHEKLLASLIRQNVDYKMAANTTEAKSLFDLNLPEDVLIQKEYNQYSGTINPRQLIQYLHRAITLKNGEVKYQHKVKSLKKNTAGTYEIEVEDLKSNETKILKSKNVVSAAGPYTGQLLKDVAPYFDTLINPQRVFLAFLKIKDSTYSGFTEKQKNKIKEAYPVINSSTGTREGSFFSMIEYFDAANNPILKIGGHFQRKEIENLDEVWKVKLEKEEIDWCLNGTLRYFKMLNIPILRDDFEIVDSYSCVYSLTSSEVPFVTNGVLDNGDKDENLLVLGGMSGVGGKGAMAYGLLGADMLLNNQSSDSMYQIAIEALGYNRLKRDIQK